MNPRLFDISRPDAPNWIGFKTLYEKEVRRFLKVAMQTLIAPIVTTGLFLAIFTLALGRAVETVGGVPFAEFLAPGLIMMAMMQNSFANTSSSLVISKIQGNIVDMLMPPLSPWELTLGFALAGVTRGVMIGIICGLGIWTVVDLNIHHWGFVIFHAFSASMLLSLIGIIGGIWSDKFDHIAAVTNFIITPLSFLSGTFYSIERLPEGFHGIALANPFFYMIDGFRYGMTGHADSNVWLGMGLMVTLNLALCVVAYRMFASGYKLKS